MRQFEVDKVIWIQIDKPNGETLSMPKSLWDAQQDAQTEPVLPPAPPAEEPVAPEEPVDPTI